MSDLHKHESYSRAVKVSSLHALAVDEAVDECFSRFMKKRPFAVIGKRLAALRNAIGLSQAELCRTIGVKPNRWNQYETGERKITLDVAMRLRRKYGITTDWIYDGDPDMLPAVLYRRLDPAA